MLTQRRYVNDDWSSRPLLSRPAVAGEQTTAQSSQFGQNRIEGVRLSGSRHFLIYSTALSCEPITAIGCVTSPKCHFQAPSHSGTQGESVAYLQARGGGGQNVFRYTAQDNLIRGSPSSFSYSWVRTRRVRQAYYQLCKQNVHSPLLCNCWDPRPPTLDWLWLNKWCQGID